MEESPIQFANPDSLQILLDKDPLGLTDSEINKIVMELRHARRLWSIEEEGKNKTKPAFNPNLKLSDLNL